MRPSSRARASRCPCKPRLGVVRLDLAAAFVGGDVHQYPLAHLLGVPAVRKFFDEAVVPRRMQFHLGLNALEGLAFRLPPISDVNLVAASQPSAHVQRLMKVANEMDDPGNRHGSRFVLLARLDYFVIFRTRLE